jgi:hypothetical protein
MTEQDWQKVKHFTAAENWGDPTKMNSALVFELDAYREFVGTPIVVSCGTNKQHLEDSMHPSGDAVDILFPEKKLTDVFELYLAAMRFGFGGLGLYNHWRAAADGEIIGGLHLDWRRDPHRALWMGVEAPDPATQVVKQVYLPVTAANLRQYGFLA